MLKADWCSADADIASLQSHGQLGTLRCATTGLSGDEPLPFPGNPNGAALNVAGISDPSGRVFGLMPHPERLHRPNSTSVLDSRKIIARAWPGTQGIRENAVNFFH
ncbi:MAG: phosphoribosylformylglycinamidine synthase subunit PurQ [Pirellulaceae bacterium]